MTKLSKEVLLKEQQLLNEINASGKYSFNQTIDDNGDIHVDCDAETLIKEMGLIPSEEVFKRFNDKVKDGSSSNLEVNFTQGEVL